jgi:hypothetical protein
LAVARALAAGVPLRADSPAAANVRAVLGNSWVGSSLASLGAHLPADAAWVLDGVRTADDLWRAEARWWMRIEADAFRLHAPARASSGAVVGVVGLLSVDAWRTRAALELAARGGGAFDEVFDGVA